MSYLPSHAHSENQHSSSRRARQLDDTVVTLHGRHEGLPNPSPFYTAPNLAIHPSPHNAQVTRHRSYSSSSLGKNLPQGRARSSGLNNFTLPSSQRPPRPPQLPSVWISMASCYVRHATRKEYFSASLQPATSAFCKRLPQFRVLYLHFSTSPEVRISSHIPTLPEQTVVDKRSFYHRFERMSLKPLQQPPTMPRSCVSSVSSLRVVAEFASTFPKVPKTLNKVNLATHPQHCTLPLLSVRARSPLCASSLLGNRQGHLRPHHRRSAYVCQFHHFPLITVHSFGFTPIYSIYHETRRRGVIYHVESIKHRHQQHQLHGTQQTNNTRNINFHRQDGISTPTFNSSSSSPSSPSPPSFSSSSSSPSSSSPIVHVLPSPQLTWTPFSWQQHMMPVRNRKTEESHNKRLHTR